MKPEFLINGRLISKLAPPYIIAEISANHNGSIDRAKETILAAKNAGADAVKLQTYTPDTMTIDCNTGDFLIREGLWKGRNLYELYAEAYTPFEWHKELFSFAKNIGLTIFSSPFDESAVDLLENLETPAYKLASFEILDLPLIRYIAKTGKPIIISTGMANFQEIENAVEAVRDEKNNNIALLHCISSYPTEIEDAQLSTLARLREFFDVEVGLSDHTIDDFVSILATGLGASIIEKHFTLNRDDGGVDSSFSLEPDEMKSLVEKTKLSFRAVGTFSDMRPQAENANRAFRRSLYFVADIKKGEAVTKNHVRKIRPGFGLNPLHYDQIIGKTCLRDAKRGDRVTKEHFID